ncbi:excinuclease ABC subunit UvrC [Acidaminococcus sp. NSJ-142]|jgi:excinuclease ABC subunit C|uniref:excinuclease ABC subunit UvrC n=1 Tax=Acidaminococcus TaxID=904 RepID=UPI000CFA50DA|nr:MULTISPECIES: excinuclease ABC subunit UvrC [Acidaminococcus]MCD2435161.1 excinuclease ABC subunit UvrC [Acidaminococcus hominis]MCH4097302.1 excinuclease ABC subunit UvrC [Acidaminococcus provencensis]RHK02138.1 excinuclease ABC subunit UvrC [Acidaminococcus sp. AM05-11]
MNQAIADTLAVLPEAPGVYIMHDSTGKVIYVGKAVILKNRVRSYFRKSTQSSPKVRAINAHVASIETIVTASEMEALILECNLIKKYRPRYNIDLKDDKTYPYLKITVEEAYPRMVLTRRVLQDGAKYYGPFADAGALRDTMKLIRTMFPLRHCRNMNVKRPCLQYHLHRCLAPCTGKVPLTEYRKLVDQVLLLMDGKVGELKKDLTEKMLQASEAMEYEKAAHYRDSLQSLERLEEKQKATTEGGDRDVIGLASDETGVCVQVFFVRGGKILGRDSFFLDQEVGEPGGDILSDFMKQYYTKQHQPPKEVLVSQELTDSDRVLLGQYLSTLAEKTVNLLVPQRGLKHDLVLMAVNNAKKNLEERLRRGHASLKTDLDAAEELQKALGLSQPLERMDCFDISHNQGRETVASMVVFRNGSPSKKDYRRYKLRSTEGKPDDFKSMQEVVYRRYKDLEDLPSLIIIDGGKGQLSSALEVIRGLGISDVPVIGLAKREEEIFKEGEHTSILLDKMSPSLHLIQHIRDEAHRFAITYHRKRLGKRNLVSVLDHLEGIGPKRREALWKRFGTLDAMKQASLEDLAAVEGMNKSAAEKVYAFLQGTLSEKQDLVQ